MSSVNKAVPVLKKLLIKYPFPEWQPLSKRNCYSNILKILRFISCWICLGNLLNNYIGPIFCGRSAANSNRWEVGYVCVSVCALYVFKCVSMQINLDTRWHESVKHEDLINVDWWNCKNWQRFKKGRTWCSSTSTCHFWKRDTRKKFVQVVEPEYQMSG